MTDIVISADFAARAPSGEESTAPRPPVQQFDAVVSEGEDEIVWPSGHKLWLNVISLLIIQLIVGLDLTIVAVAVPSLTDQFHNVSDIGWYSAAYGLTASSFVFFFGKTYSLFNVKKVYIWTIIIFEAGSLLCTVAPNSAAFICGRALAGIGNGGVYAGSNTIITHSFPNHKRPLITGLASGTFALAAVSAPLIGGVLIDAWNWRLCFLINLPIGLIAIVLTVYGFDSSAGLAGSALPLRQKIKLMDPWSTLIVIPAISCLLLALQWGGNKYPWDSAVIIVLLVLFVALAAAFGYVQYRRGDNAAIPTRLLKNRSILAGLWFNACLNGTLSITEQYLSIYFQTVEGHSATRAGILGVPLIVGLMAGTVAEGILVSLVGYYTPFMLGTTIIAPIAAGLLTSSQLYDSDAKVLVCLGMLGFAAGIGISVPVTAVQTTVKKEEVPIGLSIVGFGGGMGSAMSICASLALFQNRLITEVRHYDPTVDSAWLKSIGLSDIRDVISADRLERVLMGYDKAVVQTLYFPMALAILTVVGSASMEWRSIKKKQS